MGGAGIVRIVIDMDDVDDAGDVGSTPGADSTDSAGNADNVHSADDTYTYDTYTYHTKQVYLTYQVRPLASVDGHSKESYNLVVCFHSFLSPLSLNFLCRFYHISSSKIRVCLYLKKQPPKGLLSANIS